MGQCYTTNIVKSAAVTMLSLVDLSQRAALRHQVPPGIHRPALVIMMSWPLQWRHNRRDGVSIHKPYDCLLNRLFRCRSEEISKLRVTGLCAGNSPLTSESPAQIASNTENISISWCHHAQNRREVIHNHPLWLGCDGSVLQTIHLLRNTNINALSPIQTGRHFADGI